MPFRRIPIKPSTNLAAAEYDEENRDLLITFQRQGRQYVFHSVDPNTVEGLSKAVSSGIYFNMYIKDNPSFPSEEV